MLHFHYGETEELICKSRDVDFFEQINVGYRRTEVKPGPLLLVPAFEQADYSVGVSQSCVIIGKFPQKYIL